VLIVDFTHDPEYYPAFSRRRWEDYFLGKAYTATSDN